MSHLKRQLAVSLKEVVSVLMEWRIRPKVEIIAAFTRTGIAFDKDCATLVVSRCFIELLYETFVTDCLRRPIRPLLDCALIKLNLTRRTSRF